MRRLALLLTPTLALATACSDDGLAPLASTTSANTNGLATTTSDGGGLEASGEGSNDPNATTTSGANGSDTDNVDETSGSPPSPTGTTSGPVGEDSTGTITGDDFTTTGDGSTGTTTGEASTGTTTGDMMLPCPEIAGTSLIGGPADLYGYCWYLTAPMDTCDSACAELPGGANLALLAEATYPDSCDGPVAGDVPTWFFDNGNPGGWISMGGTTSGHTLGYGYSIVGQFYGKCSTGPTSVGTYPGEVVGGGLEDQRQLICACAEGSP